MMEKPYKNLGMFDKSEDRYFNQVAFNIISTPSTIYLQQRYGMGWYDALNYKDHLAKKNQTKHS